MQHLKDNALAYLVVTMLATETGGVGWAEYRDAELIRIEKEDRIRMIKELEGKVERLEDQLHELELRVAES